MVRLLLSVLALLTQPQGHLGAEVKAYSQKTVTNACTLVMCSPVENGLPGRDGRDGREGPRGEKGDPDITSLKQQVEALQGQVQHLQAVFSQYKKAELFPDGRGIGEKIFKTGGFEKSFQDAQKECTQAGGQLASPRSAAENAAVQQLAIAQNKAAFLSMTDAHTEGKFVYPTGEPLVYSNWAPGEPNNNGGAENCVEIFTNGKWNDKACREQRLVICEF
ncbi:Pulmonary surfactant-associated protein D [Tupaia chinensis]|uniref:Pulmonary surfactant-associated protein D n=1 Tax=Tupaia chinensis TaxID=246437 RepID=L8YEV6_TUPCH|nr:Pulmonary surfactant-associated protein D [Tupaia chinensis]